MSSSSELKQTRKRMATFDDESDRRRLVSMTGKKTGRTNREELIKNVREDRDKRVLDAKRAEASLRIQKNYRGWITRKHSRATIRDDAIRKFRDLEKLEKLLIVKQPRFAPYQATVKLIRECLYVGDVNNKQLGEAILLALRTSKPTSESDSSEQFRNSSIMRFLAASPGIPSEDIVRLTTSDPTKFKWTDAIAPLVWRACRDQSFAETFQMPFIDSSFVSEDELVSAILGAAKENILQASLVLRRAPTDMKTLILSALLNFATSTKSQRFRKCLYSGGVLNPVPQHFLADLSLRTNVLKIVVSLADQALGDVTVWAKTVQVLVCDTTPTDVLRELCEPSRVGCILDMSLKQGPANALAVCELYTRVTLGSTVAKTSGGGLSLKSLAFLGALTQFSDRVPVVLKVWDVVASFKLPLPLDSPEMDFLSAATSLYLDSVDDHELFLSNSVVTARMQAIATHLKSLLFEAVWVKANPKPSETCVSLFRKLYERSSRHFASGLVAKDVFLFPPIPLSELGLNSSANLHNTAVRIMARGTSLAVTDEEEEGSSDQPSMEIVSQASPRGQIMLRTLPFAIPFEQRVILFHSHLSRHKDEMMQDMQPRWNEALQRIEHPNRIGVQVRRDTVVEDAYENLKGKSLSGRLQVQFVNAHGLDEAGIDGGGLFKEFITLFSQQAFDPAKGLFESQNGEVFPSPRAAGEKIKVLEFVGRVLGKAVYENVLVEVALSPFVLNILRGTENSVNDLIYLDSALYRSLMSLQALSKEQIDDLGLNFTATTRLGTEIELVPGGRSIAVSKGNLTIFIERMVDFKLNREMRVQIEAFARGFNDLIDPTWVKLFSPSEMEALIGGTSKDFDVVEMKKHAVYGGGYHPSQPYIVDFWEVVMTDLSSEQRGKLLKFITSCSRPPITGFASLDPKITIYQVRDDVERLPTASTCVNLLKLPKYQTKAILREKLILAIESGAGFELS